MSADVHTFFETYRAAFARYDAHALAELFVLPLHVVSDAETVTPTSVTSRNEWIKVLDGLLGAYRRLNVAVGEPLDLAVVELSSRVASARVHWRLRSGDGKPIYDFTGFYTLIRVGDAWRVAAIAHDELPKLQALLRR